MVKKASQALAPRVRAALQEEASTDSMPRRIERTRRGKADHGRGDDRPGEGKDDLNIKTDQPGADPTVAAEKHQQQISDDHRRQDQGQIDDTLDNGLAGNAGVDQQIGDTNAQRGCQQGGGAGHLEGKKDRIIIRGLQKRHGVDLGRLLSLSLRRAETVFEKDLRPLRSDEEVIKGSCFRILGTGNGQGDGIGDREHTVPGAPQRE